jgi:transposase
MQFRMKKEATSISLSSADRAELESWSRSGKVESRMTLRAKIVLLASNGVGTNEIGRALNIRPATASKWRTRFAKSGLDGLLDAPRPGVKPIYDKADDRRVLEMLDEKPPDGFAVWTAPLLADKLEDISVHQIWRILKKYKIQLQKRHSWCISNDPEFVTKAASIVGLYLAPPENAIVLSVDEKPGIQALERAQGYIKLPSGKALRGHSHEYKRHGTTTLFAALNVVTGKVKGEHFSRRRRKEFLSFMNSVIKDYPDQEIHVILDNLSTHKPKVDKWLTRHKNVHFHFTPTHASWLNQVEIWFSILSRAAINSNSFTSPSQVRETIDAFIAAYNPAAQPFEWTATEVHSTKPRRYADLCR